VAILQHFFETLYGQATDGKLVVSWPSQTRTRPDGTPGLDSDWLDLAHASWPQIAKAASSRQYFGVILQHPTAYQIGQSRSKNTTAYIAPGLWMDIDLATGTHKQTGPLPASLAEVVTFLETLPRLPSLLVDTSGGTHAHWLFREPFVMQDEAARRDFAHLSTRFAATLAARAHAQYGWTLDRLGDLARVLRAPGMVTLKYHRHVTLHTDNAIRYNPVQDFDDWLTVMPIPTRPAPATTLLGPALDIALVAAHYGAELKKKSQAEWAGPHPQHGSSTGSNFNLNPEKGLWHCWRCGSGGDAITLVAVCEGLLPCDQARSGALKGDLFRRIVQMAHEVFGITLSRPPSPPKPWTDTTEHPARPLLWQRGPTGPDTQPQVAWHNAPQEVSSWH
jgi:hypothetical protein